MSSLPRAGWWWGFTPYAVIAVLHIGALAVGADGVAGVTKLCLMPLLAIGVLWAGRGSHWGTPYTLLFLALAFSWLGDGAATFFPAAPELPTMLACFGLTHLCYIWLFWRVLAVRPLPAWSAVYGLWWILLLFVLWPQLGALLIPVALYGLVLGGTAAAASRCHPLIAWGGAFFLASDTILAFRLFTPDAMPGWTSPLVMLTYCLGQGLIAIGVVVADRLGTARPQRTNAESV
ncbi:lysoplasmalogenase [Microbacterium sp. 4R-513]|uniref:lysoplasmalogenase n=1 Tax=Microbacterium sp. 4R-513 TaxID=2567934 RepID=UPI0013E1F581|nr:lysoplasmalogenase [Microbacterium sp. 4R-513]QIG41012.1 lysoplasmalogenase [Microbacterium sp. 4R-513]